MKSDDLLLVVIVAGAALTVWYVASVIVSFKALKAMDRAALLSARALYKRIHSVTRPLLDRRKAPRGATKPVG
jgi:hypothetical protein